MPYEQNKASGERELLQGVPNQSGLVRGLIIYGNLEPLGALE